MTGDGGESVLPNPWHGWPKYQVTSPRTSRRVLIASARSCHVLNFSPCLSLSLFPGEPRVDWLSCLAEDRGVPEHLHEVVKHLAVPAQGRFGVVDVPLRVLLAFVLRALAAWWAAFGLRRPGLGAVTPCGVLRRAVLVAPHSGPARCFRHRPRDFAAWMAARSGLHCLQPLSQKARSVREPPRDREVLGDFLPLRALVRGCRRCSGFAVQQRAVMSTCKG